MTESSRPTTPRRRVIGAPGQSRFRVVRRQIAGARQIAAGNTRTSGTQVPVSSAIANQQAYDAAQRSATTYQRPTSNVMGHQAPFDPYDTSRPEFGTSGGTPAIWETPSISPWAVNREGGPRPWHLPDPTPPPPPKGPTGADKVLIGAHTDRMKNALAKNGATIEGANPAQIKAAIDLVYMDFETTRRRFLSDKAEALRDGKDDVAAQFDSQIRNLERDIDDFTRQLETSNSVEEWFRHVIQEPFEAAKRAALDVNYQPVLDLHPSAVGRIDEEYRDSVNRLDGVFRDLGFSEDKLNAMRLSAAEDNAVAASQMDVLDATKTPKNLLEYQKTLMFHTADQLRLSNMRTSAGEQFATAATKLRDIASSNDQIGELNVERDAAIGRVERAINRAFGDAPMLPSQKQVVDTSMSTFIDSMLGEGHPWAQDYVDGAWELIYADPTLRSISVNDLAKLLESNTIGPPKARADAQIIAQQLAAGEMTRADADLAFASIANEYYDSEDLAILAGLLGVYHAANDRYSTIANKALSGSLGNTANSSGNIDQVNIRAAASLDQSNPYGERRQTVIDYGNYFKDLGFHVDLPGHMRPQAESQGNGRSSTSDHITGGALDIYFNANDPNEMNDYNTRLLPLLQQLSASGVIANIIHPGQDDYHMDHVHISFNLSGTGHSNVNTTMYNAPSGASPTSTSTSTSNIKPPGVQ